MPATITSAPPLNPLRFSLRTLLVLMTLAAIASGALFSQRSDRDEAIFILCWPVGLLAGIRLGRWRQRSGILEGALGGSISCVVASHLATKYSRPPWLDSSEYLALSIPAGFVLAAALAAIFWYLLDAPPFSGRSLRWFRICSGVGLLFGVSGLIAWGYVQATKWSPRLQLRHPPPIQTRHATRRISALSPQGNYLALQWESPYGRTQKLELFQVGRRRLQPLRTAALPVDAKSLAFSPDETWLAFLAGRPQKLQVAQLRGPTEQSLTVRYMDYRDTGDELTISRDGKQIFACWHANRVQRFETFSSDDLREQHNQQFAFTGRLFLSPGGKWLVKLHQIRVTTGYIDSRDPVRAEVVRAADLQVVCEHVIQATVDVPDRSGHNYQHLQDVINEMFPERKIRLAMEAGSLTVRGHAKDSEEAAQIVALVESQVNPTKKLPPGLSQPARLPVVRMLHDLSSMDRPLFDPDETCVAFDRRVLSLESKSQGQATVTVLPGDVVGLLPKGKALVIVEREPGWQTRIPFLRHVFPEGRFSQLCIVDVSSGEIRKRSTSFRWCYQFQLAQNCRTAAALDGHNTLQIWDVPQVD